MALGPVSVSTVGAVAAGAVVTRARGKLYATVIAKGTFEIRAGGDMVPVDAERLVTKEKHHGGSLARSVRAVSELAPYLPAADVLFTGHAHAPGGLAKVVEVRLAVWGDRLLVDKVLRVQAAEPFDKLPLVYERAYGGVGVAQNPLGTTTPNVVDPRGALQTPAGLGPISAHWPARSRLKKPVESGGIMEIPDDFDWSYFLASPPDQRAPYLAGSEWVFLQNLLPGGGQVRSRLPDVRAFTRIRWTRDGEAGAAAALQADTLQIDGDAGRCALVFRGVFPLPDGAKLEEVRPAVALSIAGSSIDWTSATLQGRADDLSATLAHTPSAPSDAPVSLGGTLSVSLPADPGVPLPFRQARVKEEARATAAAPSGGAPLPGTPWSGIAAKPARKPASKLAGTIVDDDAPPAPGPAAPAPVAPAPVASVPAVEAPVAVPAPFPGLPVKRPSEPAPAAPAEPSAPVADPWAKPVKSPAPPRAPAPPQPQGPAAVLTFVRKGGYDRFKR